VIAILVLVAAPVGVFVLLFLVLRRVGARAAPPATLPPNAGG
jgi:hypothetical protein